MTSHERFKISIQLKHSQMVLLVHIHMHYSLTQFCPTVPYIRLVNYTGMCAWPLNYEFSVCSLPCGGKQEVEDSNLRWIPRGCCCNIFGPEHKRGLIILVQLMSWISKLMMQLWFSVLIRVRDWVRPLQSYKQNNNCGCCQMLVHLICISLYVSTHDRGSLQLQ